VIVPAARSAACCATLAAAFIAVAPAPLCASDWSRFRNDAQLTGFTDGALPDALQPLWSFQADTGIESTAAIVGSTVYVASLDGNLFALDLETGARKWTYASGEAIKSSPAVHDGVVYFGDEGGILHAVDAASGSRRWTFAAEGGIISSPNHAAGRLLFGSYDNSLYGLDLKDGTLAWRLETEGYVHATPAIWKGDDGEPLAVSAGCDGALRLVRVKDGGEVRKIDLGAYVASSPAISGDRAFLGSFDNEVLGVDLRKGTIVWTYAPQDREFPFYASPAVAGGMVIIGGRDKRVHALRAGTGELIWSYATRGRIDASPVVQGDRIFVASTSGELLALDRNGKPVWQFDAGSAIVASPSIAAGRLIVGTVDGTLLCFGAPS
jgi:outer membrane protein assembly factor BamB